MNKTDEIAIRSGVRIVLERQERARQALLEQVAEKGFTADQARKIVNIWLRRKLVKYNGLDYRVIHGGLWDGEALKRALAFAEQGE